MAPAEFMSEIVVPTLRELRDDLRSRRQAYLACIAEFYLKDHLKKMGENDIENAMRVSAASVVRPARKRYCRLCDHGPVLVDHA